MGSFGKAFWGRCPAVEGIVRLFGLEQTIGGSRANTENLTPKTKLIRHCSPSLVDFQSGQATKKLDIELDGGKTKEGNLTQSDLDLY